MKAKFETGDLVCARLNKHNYNGLGLIVTASPSHEFVEVYWMKEGITRTMSHHYLSPATINQIEGEQS